MKIIIILFIVLVSSNIMGQNNYISNKDYREFVQYVQDSLFRQTMGEEVNEEAYLNVCYTCDESNMIIGVNWETKLDINTPWAREALEPWYYSPEERFYRKREIDTRKLIHNGIAVYPDVLIWCKDSLNNKSWAIFLTKYYFTHKYFDDFPVQGVSEKQLEQYLNWKFPKSEVKFKFSEKQIKLNLPKEKLKITVKDYFELYQYTRDSIIRMELCRNLDEWRYCKSINQYNEEINPPIVKWKHKIKWKDDNVIKILKDCGLLTKDNTIDNRKVMFKYYKLDYYRAITLPDTISRSIYINRIHQCLADEKYIKVFSNLNIRSELRSKIELDYQDFYIGQLHAYYLWKKGTYSGKDVFEGFIPYYNGIYWEEDPDKFMKNNDIELFKTNKLSNDFYVFTKNLKTIIIE